MVAYIFKIYLARTNRLWTKTLDKYTRAGMHECGQENVRATARDNTGHNAKDILSPSIEIKISDPVGNRTPAAGLDGTYSIFVIIMYSFLRFTVYELQ